MILGPAAWPAAAALSLLAILGSPGEVAAQQNSIALAAGVIQYDAGGDQTYPLFTLRGGREVLPWLRLGLGVSLGTIGEIPRGPAFLSGGSESLWRFFTNATAVADRPFRNSGVAIFDRVSPEGGVGVGVVHSAGTEVNPEVFADPYNGIEDQPTGLALGVALGIGIEISTNVSLRVTGTYWRDRLYGSTLDDFELTGGVAVRW
jgi:hypothetical protein